MARKFPVKGLTPALCLAALVLTGCGAQRGAAPAPTATTATAASTPTATPAAAPLASATTGYPSSMAVLGHSNATGEDSDPAQPHAVIRANSWATGTNPAVNSVYLRILAKNPAIKGHNYNLAQPGATVEALLLQARQAVTLTPKPGLFLVQIMDADIVCPETHGDYATFRSKLITALGVLARGAPALAHLRRQPVGQPHHLLEGAAPRTAPAVRCRRPGRRRHRPMRVHRSPRPARA